METKQETIESGIIGDAIRGLGKLFGKAFADTLDELDKQMRDVKTNSEGGMIATVQPADKSLQWYKFKIDNPQANKNDDNVTAWLSFQDPSGRAYENVMKVLFKPADSEDAQENNEVEDQTEDESNTDQTETKASPRDIFEEGWDIVNIDDVTNMFNDFEDSVMKQFPIAASMKVALQKIVGSDETSISLLGVETDQNPDLALSTIDSILDDEEFVESIPDEEVNNYVVYNYDDNYTIEPLESVLNSSEDFAFKQILFYTLLAHNAVDRVYFENSDESQVLLAERARWELDEDIRKICNYIKIYNGSVPDFNLLLSEYTPNIRVFDTVESSIGTLISCIKLYKNQISEDDILWGLNEILINLETNLV